MRGRAEPSHVSDSKYLALDRTNFCRLHTQCHTRNSTFNMLQDTSELVLCQDDTYLHGSEEISVQVHNSHRMLCKVLISASLLSTTKETG
jgi:hypothetical protein